MVGGGLSVGFGVLETAVKEAAEEASVPADLAGTMTPVGCVSFYFESERGLFPNTEFIYDMELPVDFVPDNSDGEVQGFELLAVSESLEMLFSPDFKTTSAPVVIDFLVRWGLITPDAGKSAAAERSSPPPSLTLRFRFRAQLRRAGGTAARSSALPLPVAFSQAGERTDALRQFYQIVNSSNSRVSYSLI